MPSVAFKPQLQVKHFARKGITTLLFQVAAICETKNYICGQGQALQQSRWDNIAEYLLSLTFCKMLQALMLAIALEFRHK